MIYEISAAGEKRLALFSDAIEQTSCTITLETSNLKNIYIKKQHNMSVRHIGGQMSAE